jgi:hypothetical protein
MRHRHRVHELEGEVATLRSHLDHVLEMPDHSTSRLPAKHVTADAAALDPVAAPPVAQAALPEVAASNGGSAGARKSDRRKAEPAVVAKPTAETIAEPLAKPTAGTIAEPLAMSLAEPAAGA